MTVWKNSTPTERGLRYNDTVSSLFDSDALAGPAAFSADAPLAARMRPRTLDEVAGQRNLLAPGKSLRLAVERDRLTLSSGRMSVVVYS